MYKYLDFYDKKVFNTFYADGYKLVAWESKFILFKSKEI